MATKKPAAKAATGTGETAPVVKPVTFLKAQILASRRYSRYRDVLGALLKDGRAYELDKIDGLIEKFMKEKVR